MSPDSLINAEGELTIETEVEPEPPEVSEVEVVDPTEQIAQNPCTQGLDSEFIITGRGGLPPTPNQVLSSDSARVGWVDPAPVESRGRGCVRPQVAHTAPQQGSRGAGKRVRVPQSQIHNLKSTIRLCLPEDGYLTRKAKHSW